MQRIIPNIWCDKNAEEVAAFYERVFPETSSRVTGRYPESGLPEFQQGFEGKAITIDVTIGGYQISLINSDDSFHPTPAISCMLNMDPLMFGGDIDAARTELDRRWQALVEGGEVLMKLGEYPHSARYGWLQDRFGVSWQLMLTDPSGDPRPAIVPCLMFAGDVDGEAQAAMDLYTAVLDDTEVGTVAPYAPGARETPGLMFADFRSGDDWIAVMDGGTDHAFTFTCGMSLEVRCNGQGEIDRLWTALSAVPEAEACGWLADRFGVSWQIVPANLGELMQRPDAFEHLMGMKKIVIDQI